MNSARGGLVSFVGGAAFAAAFITAGAIVAALQLGLLHQSDPKFGGPADNFAFGLYLVGAGCLFATPAFVIATAPFRAWRALSLQRALAFAVPAGALAFLLQFVGLLPLLFSWLVPRRPSSVVTYGTYFCISGLLTGLLVVSLARRLWAPVAAS